MDQSARKRTCFFLGTRFSQLFFGPESSDNRNIQLKACLSTAIFDIAARGVRHFRCGLQIGTDIWCAEAVLALRREHPEWRIKLHILLPYPGYGEKMGTEYQQRRARILAEADEVCHLDDRRWGNSVLNRYRLMAEQSGHLIMVENNLFPHSFEARTLAYAKRLGVDCVCIRPWLSGFGRT